MFFYSVAGYCQNLDELIPTSNHDSPTVVPKFVSRGHLYKAIVGDTIELPCKVQNLGMQIGNVQRFVRISIEIDESFHFIAIRTVVASLISIFIWMTSFYRFNMRCELGSFVLLWRRGTSVLTAGHLKITRDDRFKIVGDYNLQISNVKTQDAGDYICQIGDQETRDQVHTVEILGKPSDARHTLISVILFVCVTRLLHFLQFHQHYEQCHRTDKLQRAKAAQWHSNARRLVIQCHQSTGSKRYPTNGLMLDSEWPCVHRIWFCFFSFSPCLYLHHVVTANFGW